MTGGRNHGANIKELCTNVIIIIFFFWGGGGYFCSYFGYDSTGIDQFFDEAVASNEKLLVD